MTTTNTAKKTTKNMTGTYQVWLVNFGYYMPEVFESWDEAIRTAKGTSFECRIDYEGAPVASWGCISGLRIYNPAFVVG